MTVKTTGAELVRFYNDREWWPEGRYHEEEQFKLNGVVVDDIPDDISPKDAISIAGGYVTDDPGRDYGTFEGYFKRWRAKQNTSCFLVECNVNEVAYLKMEIKRLGGKVQ